MNYTVGETFVGCGGSHEGFKRAGFESVFANDIWADSLKTLKQNNSDCDLNIVHDDINNVTASSLNLKKNLDVLIGGVVCKGFSLAGVRNPCDQRNYLYLQQLRLVKELKPKISIIENVPGMISMNILNKTQEEEIICLTKKMDNVCEEHKKVRANIINLNKKEQNAEKEKEKLKNLTEERKIIDKQLDKYKYNVVDHIFQLYEQMDYTVYKKVLICSEYECYTNRKRLFIIAIRNDIHKKEWKYPEPLTKDLLPTVKDALTLLDPVINDPKNDPDNVPMKHTEKTIEKFKKVSIDKKNNDEKFFSRGTSNRLDYSKPAPTLVPGHSSFQIHPVEHRSITVREGALITGFPKEYKFFGSHTSRCMQIGNAIPVNMAKNIALKCKEYLDDVLV
tara:strand:- start:25847 stop:27022 length:1176 start_codon:yes stop_codon:yes gene_type:complete